MIISETMPPPRTRGPRRRAIVAALALAGVAFGAVALPARPALARACCGKLASHLYQLGDSFEIGAELRTFYFGVTVGDGLPSSKAQVERVYENNFMLGLRPAFNWFPIDGLTVSLEGEMRFKRPGWEANAVPGLDGRPVYAALAYDAGWLDVTAGVHPQIFGTAAALDQRFLGVSANHKNDWVTLSLFGGVTNRFLMKNAGSCLWMRYASDNIGWKTVSTRLEDNYLVGFITGLRKLKPFSAQLLYLFESPSVEILRSHVVSGFFRGPIVRPYLDFELELLAQIKTSGSFVPGLVGMLRGRLGNASDRPRFAAGAASSFGEREDRRLASVLENLSWGMIRRFSLYNGHVFTLQGVWPYSKHFEPFVDYFIQTFAVSDADLSDELDAGFWVAISDLYRLRLAYVGMNLAGPAYASSHAIYAELRLILGS